MYIYTFRGGNDGSQLNKRRAVQHAKQPQIVCDRTGGRETSTGPWTGQGIPISSPIP